jgi:hypothetical protein
MSRTGGNAASATRFRGKRRPLGGIRSAAHYDRIPRGSIWCAAVLGWALAAPVHAAQSDWGVGLAMVHNTNINRVETGAQSELTQVLGAGFTYAENSADLNARIYAQVNFRHFYRHTNPDDTIGILDGAIGWTLLPQRLTWTVENVFRQLAVGVTAPITPSNLTKSNTFSTGPDLTYPLNSANTLALGARYGRFDVQNSNADTRRYTAFARGLHRISPQSTFSVNFEAGRVYFEPGAQAFPDVYRQDLFGRYDTQSGTGGLTIDVGTTSLTPTGGEKVSGNRLLRLTVFEAPSPRSVIRLAYVDQVSDTYTDMLAGLSGSTVGREGVLAPTAVNIATSDLYDAKTGVLAYVNKGAGRFDFTLQGRRRQVDFVTLDQDYHENGLRFEGNWVLSGATQLRAFADTVRRTYDSFTRQDIESIFAVSTEFRLNRSVTLAAYIDRAARQSTVEGSGYVDNRIYLAVAYSAGGSYDFRSRRQ